MEAAVKNPDITTADPHPQHSGNIPVGHIKLPLGPAFALVPGSLKREGLHPRRWHHEPK